MQRTIIAIIISYLIGSIPTAYIFGRVIKGVDIRTFGSKNVGATNALRLLGKGWGVTVLVLDILKGFLPVMLAFTQEQNLLIAIGLGCICGHIWTVFLGFKGGKGVATTFGVLLGLALKINGLNIVLGLTILVWFLIFLFSRMISLASVISALSFPIFTILFKQSYPVIFIGTLLSALIILRHSSNIKRILVEKETKLSFKK